MSSFLSRALNSVDMFERPVQLNLNGKRQLSSSLGGFLSLAVVIFLFVQFVIKLAGMYDYNDPKIIQVNEYSDDPESILLNNTNNFMMAVSFNKEGDLLNLTQDSLVSFTGTFNQNFRNPDGTTTKYKSRIYWAPCEESSFESGIFEEGSFKTYSLQYAYCPKYINFANAATGVCPDAIKKDYPSCITPPHFNIKGTYLSLDFEFIQFKLTTCSQTNSDFIEGLNCKTGDLTTDFNSGEVQMNLYFSNTLIDPAEHSAPNKTYLDTIYWNVNPSVSKIADIFMDVETVQDMDSFYSSRDKNTTYYSIQSEKMRELQQFQSTTLLQWNIRRSNINHVTSRTYTKLLEIVSDIGGLSSVLMAVGAAIAVQYTRYKYNTILSNQLYDYEPVRKKNSNKVAPSGHSSPAENSYLVQANRSQKPNKSATRSEIIMKLFTLKKKPKNNVKEYFDLLRLKKREMPYGEISFIKYIFHSIFRKTEPEEKLAQKGREQVLKGLDIVQIIEKLQEIDKLKLLLLNKHQREAFNFIEKPLIGLQNNVIKRKESITTEYRDSEMNSHPDRESSNQQENNVFTAREEYSSMSTYGKLYAAYHYLNKDADPINVVYNRKLLDMIGDDLITVFKQIDNELVDETDTRRFEEIVDRILNKSFYNLNLEIQRSPLNMSSAT